MANNKYTRANVQAFIEKAMEQCKPSAQAIITLKPLAEEKINFDPAEAFISMVRSENRTIEPTGYSVTQDIHKLTFKAPIETMVFIMSLPGHLILKGTTFELKTFTPRLEKILLAGLPSEILDNQDMINQLLDNIHPEKPLWTARPTRPVNMGGGAGNTLFIVYKTRPELLRESHRFTFGSHGHSITFSAASKFPRLPTINQTTQDQQADTNGHRKSTYAQALKNSTIGTSFQFTKPEGKPQQTKPANKTTTKQRRPSITLTNDLKITEILAKTPKQDTPKKRKRSHSSPISPTSHILINRDVITRDFGNNQPPTNTTDNMSQQRLETTKGEHPPDPIHTNPVITLNDQGSSMEL